MDPKCVGMSGIFWGVRMYGTLTLKNSEVRLGLVNVGTSYFCSVCCMDLPNSVEALQHHLQKYADKHAIVVKVPPIAFPSTGEEVLVRKTVRLVDFATTNDALNEQLLKTLKRVESPMTMLESASRTQIFDLRCEVFNPTELEVMTKIVSHLERKGTHAIRSKARGSSRICMWGMRSAYGDTGWYVQDDPRVYGLSEDFARFVCKILKREYATLFEHLESIPRVEGFDDEDARIGGGPFSSFSTARDFNCRPHKDEDDYDYGFIFWLREGNSTFFASVDCYCWELVLTEILAFMLVTDAIPEGVELAIFAFPEVGVSFVPKHGDVLCFRPGQYLHCTRRLHSTNLLGVALFQKCSLYRRLGQLIFSGSIGCVEYNDKKGETKVVETRTGFLAKKKLYKQCLHESTLSILHLMVSYSFSKKRILSIDSIHITCNSKCTDSFIGVLFTRNRNTSKHSCGRVAFSIPRNVEPNALRCT